MDSPVVFFLKSKRFWAGILGLPLGWLLTKYPPIMDMAVNVCTTMSDLPAEQSCDPVVTRAFVIGGVAYALSWAMGMFFGNRKLALTPAKPAPADSQDSGDANAITPAPKG